MLMHDTKIDVSCGIATRKNVINYRSQFKVCWLLENMGHGLYLKNGFLEYYWKYSRDLPDINTPESRFLLGKHACFHGSWIFLFFFQCEWFHSVKTV